MIKAIHTPMYVANVAVFRRIASSLHRGNPQRLCGDLLFSTETGYKTSEE